MVSVSAVFSSAAFLVLQDKPVSHRAGNLLRSTQLKTIVRSTHAYNVVASILSSSGSVVFPAIFSRKS